MPCAVRKIDHKGLWSKTPTTKEESVWLVEGDLRADALVDLETDDNRLSIYVLDDGAGVTIERLVGAIAANRGNNFVAKVDYVVFDLDIVGELKIEIDSKAGETPDAAVNACHRDLVHLTASKLADLGKSMQRRGEVSRVQPGRVGRLINASLRAGHIDSGKVGGELLAKLKDPRYTPVVGR